MVRKALDSLSPSHGDALRSLHEEGLSPSPIADRLRRPLATGLGRPLATGLGRPLATRKDRIVHRRLALRAGLTEWGFDARS